MNEHNWHRKVVSRQHNDLPRQGEAVAISGQPSRQPKSLSTRCPRFVPMPAIPGTRGRCQAGSRQSKTEWSATPPQSPILSNALHRRHDDRHRQLPEPAFRDHRRAALPRAGEDADPHGSQILEAILSLAGRRRDRAARADLQAIWRGAGFRVRRGAEEGLSACDDRRQAVDISEEVELDESKITRWRRWWTGSSWAATREGDQGRHRGDAAGGRALLRRRKLERA